MVNNDGNGRIGCEAGRTRIIDPNDFNGFNSSSNMSVPVEDLNISVILRTQRKGRTVLSTDKDKNSVATSSKNVEVNFIQADKINGERVLTTKYTDLTTIHEYGTVNTETLGITNIDIDFNTSYTPQITINFVDLRGSSIFQNEDGITDFDNPYSTFFQIPYPTFELEIKGYYGKPVTYCLHMIKMNSKFNSKTGNFEIQCEFVGYTYAMLSDLLIGFLRANALTDIGIEKYKLYNDNKTTQPVLTLQDLKLKLQNLNEGIGKATETSPNSVGFENTKKALDLISDIKNIVNIFGSALESTLTLKESSFKDNYPYIVVTQTQFELETKSVDSYVADIERLGNEWNSLNLETKFDIKDFQNISSPIDETRGRYQSITKGMFNSNNDSEENYIKTEFKPKDIKGFKEKIYSYLNENFTLNEDTIVHIYNMNYIYDTLITLENKLKEESKRYKEGLAVELKETVRKGLSFSPTIRNIIEIYTAASEVFLESIYDVSVKAEADNNTKRQAQLASKFVHVKNSDLKNIKNNPDTNEKPKYFAWPDYKEDDGKGLYTEKYLGSVLARPLDVEEIAFVEKLYQAFIKAAQADNEAELILNRTEKHWTPINPLDTKLLGLEEPYGRIENPSVQDIIRMAVIRGMTFLGYTNKEDSLTDKEIIAMGEAEADNILRSADNKVTQALISKVKDLSTSDTTATNATKPTLFDYINSSGNINGEETKLIFENSKDRYIYNYIYEGKYNSVIPINKNFQGEWPLSKEGLINEANSGNLFLTNYSSKYGPENSTNKYNKIEDGGVYIKIITIDEYTGIANEFPLNELPKNYNTKSVFSLRALQENEISTSSASSSAGFNVLGGQLGVQDFNIVTNDIGGTVSEIPISSLFYSTSFNEQPNGLAFDRKNSNVNPVRVYDIKANDRINGTKPQYYKTNDGKEVHKNLGLTRALLVNNTKTNYVGVSFPYFEQTNYAASVRKTSGNMRDGLNTNSFSLFGSKFYYSQKNQYGKAFLFLNNLPFNKGEESLSPFAKNEIKHLFDTRGGLIHAPLLWCAWVGSVLWRLDVSAPVIENGVQTDGGSGSVDPIRWFGDGVKENTEGFPTFPNRFQYLSCVNFVDFDRKAEFVDITKGDILVNLPVQVKKEFKRIFFEFVMTEGGTSAWDEIRNNLEIWDGMDSDFNKLVDYVYKGINNGEVIKYEKLLNFDKYRIIAPVKDSDFPHYLFLELDGDYSSNPAISTLINKMNEEVIIVNTGYEIWQSSVTEDGDLIRGEENKVIGTNKTKFNLYFNSLNKRLSDSKAGLGDTDKNNQINTEIFGTSNQDIIKLRIYKHCKNIYDKWIGGTTDPDKIMFRCGVNSENNGRSKIDSKLALRYGNKKAKFIDSFRFVSRSFEDIGDKLYINPTPINDYLTDNQNACVYDSISSLLASNNFDFIALPTYINFNDEEDLKAVFKPYPNYTKAISEGTCGPTFVCTYVGETSKHLAIANSEYANDGFDLRCITDSKILANVPSDFTSTANNYEDPIAVFTVKYSQQNQNIFKDITLDQSEFTETEESLKIMDDISQKGSETNRTIAGQNLYSVYSVRSYKTEVEMMGNAMIQPMMYFQLDNIPMFHGAYMVIRTKHSIKPNYMSTNFTGVRIKYNKTPEITALDVYMSLIDTLDTSSAIGRAGISGNYVDIYYNDLMVNKPKNRRIEGSKLPTPEKFTKNAETEYNFWDNGSGIVVESDEKGTALIKKYAKKYAPNLASSEPWSAVFISYLMNTVDSNFNGSAIHKSYVTNAMNGNNGYEVFPLNGGLDIKAEIGDIFCSKRGGGPDASHCDVLYKIENGKAFLIGGNRGVKGGSNANEGKIVKASEISLQSDGFITDKTEVGGYKLLIKKTNNTYYKNKKIIGTSVSNGLANIPTGNNADYWTLVTICGLENDTAQGRCDVAQSIYNRLLSNIYVKKTIKELIIAPKQYEPVSRAKSEFNLIKDKDTAINAFRVSKKCSTEQAKTHIENTISALKNTTLITNSQNFIQGRTDFYSDTIVNTIKDKFKVANNLISRDGQTFGWFAGPVAFKYGVTDNKAKTAVIPVFNV